MNEEDKEMMNRNMTHKGKTRTAHTDRVKAGLSRPGRSRRAAYLMLACIVSLVMVMGGAWPVFADDLTNTVPKEENPGGSFYSNEIHTYLGDNGFAAVNGPSYGPYTVDGVVQSLSTTSATTFAAGLPLGTIFIDQSKISTTGGIVDYVSPDTTILAGLVTESNGRVGYDGRKPNAKQLIPGIVNRLDGELFTVKFNDAAILPNGDRADMLITYSNARIVIDQRYASAPADRRYLDGVVFLAQGNQFTSATSDSTDFTRTSYGTTGRNAVDATAKNYTYNGNPIGFNADSEKSIKTPAVGTTMDATYRIVNKDGTPAAGTFVFAMAGINLDRDPDVGSQNNVNKPLWYSYNDNFWDANRVENGKEYSFFSEAMSINSGIASKNIYVRPNNTTEDNPGKISGLRGQYFWPNISKDSNGRIKFISNANTGNTYSGHDESYNAGFVTLADAARGITVTRSGHGWNSGTMNTPAFNSKQIWYRYTSTTSDHGRIQTTSEGNYYANGDYENALKDGGTVVGTNRAGVSDTRVVTEGKTVRYTMTPDIGYKMSSLRINGSEVRYDGGAASKMKKGDQVSVTTAAGKDGTLRYEENGTYTFIFPHAEHDETIHVEWEPTTADLLVSKVWEDEDDKDGMRGDADRAGTLPKVRLQYSLNGGRTWTDVTTNNFLNGVAVSPRRDTITPYTVPSGQDAQDSSKYLDGTYEIQKGTKEHPFTWEYLPVYTYDANGTADKMITYRIVEDPDPGINSYKNAQYFDSQAFELTSEESKTFNGWLIYRDGSNNEYVLKGDGKYYAVIDGKESDKPAAQQPDPNKLSPVDSNEYRTEDKAIAYQAVEVKNEHQPRDVYVEVTKNWNDAELKNAVTTSGTKEYERKDIKYILQGTTASGSVDLNGDAAGTDLELIIRKDESHSRTEATGDGGDDTFKIDDDNFGALFENLPTHDQGKVITYTVKEQIHVGSTNADWRDAGHADVAWKTTGGDLSPVRNDANEIIGYQSAFVNTPVVDDVYETLPLTILKRDKVSKSALEGAEFTVYLNAINGTKPLDNKDQTRVEGRQIFTDGSTEYVLRADGKYYTFAKSGDNYTYAEADPQPAEATLTKKVSQVESKVVATRTNGQATINFLEPGTYYIQETKAPEGYTADPTIYEFKVDRNLKSITLENAEDPDHPTKWWKKLYDLLFHSGVPSGANWKPAENKGAGTLTVDDDPVSANILVRKSWEDNSDQDGVRPKDGAAAMPRVILEWTTGAHTATGLPVYQDGNGTKYVHNQSDNKYYKVTEEDKQGTFENGAADPQPQDPQKTTETCKGREVYEAGGTNYVYVDGTYRVVSRLDTTGSVEADPAGTQPAESSLQLVMDGGWTRVKIPGDTDGSEKDAEAQVTYAGGPVLTHQHDAYTWNSIPAYRNGKPVTYRVVESSTLLDNGTYSMKYSHTSQTNEKVFTLVNRTGQTVTTYNQTVDVTNHHATRVIDLKAYKKWNDSENQDNRQEATLTLYKTVNGSTSIVTKTDGGSTRPDTGTVPVETTQDPVKIWRNLPAFEYGYPITYTIEESTVDGYRTTYKVDYTRAASGSNPETEVDEIGRAVPAAQVKRTYYQEGDQIPEGKSVGDESTAASFHITNDETVDVEVSKTWIDGANTNVIFELWRTTKELQGNKDFQKCTAYYRKGDEDTRDRISPEAYDLLSSDEKAQYNEVKGLTWNPNDPNTDGWEQATDENGQPLTHMFLAADFSNKPEPDGDTKTYTFQDLPKEDDNGNTYTYRVFETPRFVRFASNQGPQADAEPSEGKDHALRNINLQANDATASFEVVKELKGREWKPDDRFYFEIEAVGGRDLTDNTSLTIDQVPMPRRQYNENNTTKTEILNTAETDIKTKVGALGRAVPFGSIIYKDNYQSAPAAFRGYYPVEKGHTAEFNYVVREVYGTDGKETVVTGDAATERTKTLSIDEKTNHTGRSDKGISYEGKAESGSFRPTEHQLTVKVTNPQQGNMIAEVYWDGSSTANTVPVITNTYDASAKVHSHIIKRVQGREFEGGDSFRFNVTNLAGAAVRTSETGDPVTSPTTGKAATITDSSGEKVRPGTEGYEPAESADGNNYRAVMSDSYTWIRLSDLGQTTTVNGNKAATDTFIYELKEDRAASRADQEDLLFDTGSIYMKVVATDNLKGGLDIQKSYHTDASCTDANKINANLLVFRKDLDQFLGKDYKKGDPAPAGARITDREEGEDGELLYEYVPAALFTNTATMDIPVKKEWVDGPAAEDVTLRIQRHLIPLEQEASLDAAGESTGTDPKGDDFVRALENSWSQADKTSDLYKDNGSDFWANIGRVLTVPRGDFLREDGTPDFDSGSETTVTRSYENIENFNKDLPKYVTVNGRVYRAVYRLSEDDTSDAYTTSYRSDQPSGGSKEGDRIFIDSGTLVATNRVIAQNTVSIAAVKQLLGRNWSDEDDFGFELKPAGVGTYYGKNETGGEEGDFKGIDDSDQAKARTPMPEGATASARESDTTVDPNGDLERLARFGAITYRIKDLTYDPARKHYQGDFFYTMKESLPEIDTEGEDQSYPLAYTYSYKKGDKTETKTQTITNQRMPQLAEGQSLVSVKWNDGITYDMTEHTVHVKVRENRTGTLEVQIGYDEKQVGDISSGTQFTPVCTNTYASEGSGAAQVRKRIMGRYFKVGDSFDFTITPIAGAPFEEADMSEFADPPATNDREREAALSQGKAVRTGNGGFRMRLSYQGDSDAAQAAGGYEVKRVDEKRRLYKSLPKLRFTSNDLQRRVSAQMQSEDETRLSYSDGRTVPVGTAYGEFVYAIREVACGDSAMKMDPDTEYAKFTVIDRGDGTLDISVRYYEDRYCTELRYELNNDGTPQTDEEGNKILSGAAPFVNQIKRDLRVTKAWAGPATTDVTLRLQWSVNGTGWYNVDQATFLEGVKSTQTIRRDAAGSGLTVTWDNLPAYANIIDVDDQTGDTIDTNDKWLYYQVIEEPEANVEIRYNTKAYQTGDTLDTKITTDEGEVSKYSKTPHHTEGEYLADGKTWFGEEDRVDQLYVTNFPHDVEGTAKFGVVKQYLGKAWDDEVFNFKVTPVKSKLGRASDFTNDGDEMDVFTGYYVNEDDPADRITEAEYNAGRKTDGSSIDKNDYKEETEKKINRMPSVAKDTATATADTEEVSVNERGVNFDGITIRRSDLQRNAKGVDYGEFIYEISEIIPKEAVKITEGTGENARTYYAAVDAKGNTIKYTGQTHTVKLVATNDGGGDVDIVVSYDSRETGQYVPVFTNYAMLDTPIQGTKTWVGGKKNEHVNGTVTLDGEEVTESSDKLGLKIYRRLKDQKDEEATELTTDDAGRKLAIVWIKETTTSETVITYENEEDGTEITPEEYEALPEGDKASYTRKETKTNRKEIKKQEGGDGTGPYTYTVKAIETDTDAGSGEETTRYVDPVLNAVNEKGQEYAYIVREGNVPKGYTADCRGLDVVNTSNEVVTDTIKATKKLEVSAGNETVLTGGEFYFELLGKNASSGKFDVLMDVKTNGAPDPEGSDRTKALIQFDPIPYTQAQAEADAKAGIASYDAAKKTWTYTYKIRELVPEAAGRVEGIRYDTSEKTILVVVQDEGEGALSISKYLGSVTEGNKIEDSSAGDEKITFTNRIDTMDIPVAKVWSGTPAEDVTLHLERALIDPDKTEDDEIIAKSEAEIASEAAALRDGDWKAVGLKKTIPRSQFKNGITTVVVGKGTDTQTTKYIGFDENFNNDLPMYVSEGGVLKRAVYRLTEDDTSNVYKKNYGNRIYISNTSAMLSVTNQTVAEGTGNVGAVKQLLDRSWTDQDEFTFNFKPLGKADYVTTASGNAIKLDDKGRVVYQMSGGAVDTDIPEPADLQATARSSTALVGEGEHLARFGDISFATKDLVYDEIDKHLQGDFYYSMQEKIPASAVLYDRADGKAKAYGANDSYTFGQACADNEDDIADNDFDFNDKANRWWKVLNTEDENYNGLVYDGRIHTVHIKVRENRSGQLQVKTIYDQPDGNQPDGTTEGTGNWNQWDDNTGSLFTPVFTNHYEAKGSLEAVFEKEILGRDPAWNDGNEFTFAVESYSGEGAPMPLDANGQIKRETTVKTASERGKTDRSRKGSFGTLHFDQSNLYAVYPAGHAKAGTRYGIYYYCIYEKAGNDADLSLDETRYFIRVLVEDSGNGRLTTSARYYGSALDLASGTGTEVSGDKPITFENVKTRELYVKKTWKGTPVVDARIHLEKSTDDGNRWEPVTSSYQKYLKTTNEVEEWTDVTDNSDTFTMSEFDAVSGDSKSVTHRYRGLPSYEVVTTTTGQGANATTTTKAVKLRYRVVEDDPEDTDDEDKTGFITPGVAAEDAQSADAAARALTITNQYKAAGSQKVNVVKQLLGRDWKDSDRFNYSLKGVERVTEYDPDGTVKTTDASDSHPGGRNPMPGETDKGDIALTGDTGGIPAGASGSDEIVANERLATFADISFDESDLIMNPATGRLQGDFLYEIREVIPEGATATVTVAGETKTFRYSEYTRMTDAEKAAAANQWTYQGVKYQSKTDKVHIRVTDDLNGKLETEVAYNEGTKWRTSTGKGFTPVYINSYSADGQVTIPVTKHLNGRKWKQGDSFEFVLQPLAGAPMPKNLLGTGLKQELKTEAKYADADPQDLSRDVSTSFEPIPVDREGEYIYRIQETRAGQIVGDAEHGKLQYAADPIYVKVTVRDSDKTGTMAATAIEYYTSSACEASTKIDGASSAVFTNTVLRDIKVTKKWLGEAASDVTVRLQQSVNAGQTWTDVTEGSWYVSRDWFDDTVREKSNTIENLPAFAEDGAQILYRAVEESGQGYESDAEEARGGKAADAHAEGQIKEIKVTNRNTATTSISGTKTWVDGGRTHADTGKDLGDKLELHRAYGSGSSAVADEKVTKDAGGSDIVFVWSGEGRTVYTVSNLPKYDGEGNEITYWVEEAVNGAGEVGNLTINGGSTDTGAPEETVSYGKPSYTNKDTAVTDKALDGAVITNTIRQEKIRIYGQKVWDHGDNDPAAYPDAATMRLYQKRTDDAEPVPVEGRVLTIDGAVDTVGSGGSAAEKTEGDRETAPADGTHWNFQFEDLPKYDETGAEILYSVSEDKVRGYKLEGTSGTGKTEGDRCILTNKFGSRTLGQVFHVTKTVDGMRTWYDNTGTDENGWPKAGDEDAQFVFNLISEGNTAGVSQPMPQGSVSSDTTYNRQVIDSKNSYDSGFSFGSITFDTPGTYYYHVRELTAAQAGVTRISGMTYDDTIYTIEIKVKEDLSWDIRVTDDEGNEIPLTVADGSGNSEGYYDLKFENIYRVNQTTYHMEALKAYYDRSRTNGNTGEASVVISNEAVKDKFQFFLRPVKKSGADADAADVPMPTAYYSDRTRQGLKGSGADRIYYTVNNEGFLEFEKGITYYRTRPDTDPAVSDIDKQYTYAMGEVIPDAAVYIGEGFWFNEADQTVYDGVIHYRTIQVKEVNNAVQAIPMAESAAADQMLRAEIGQTYGDAAEDPRYVNAPQASDLYPRHHNSVPQFFNYRNPLVDIEADKVWEDDNDRDGKRPDYTWFRISRQDGEHVTDIFGNDLTAGSDLPEDVTGALVKINGSKTDQSLKAVWKDLPRYKRIDRDSTGDKRPHYAEIKYLVEEIDEPAGNLKEYTNTVSGPKKSTGSTGRERDSYTITNKHIPEKIDVKVIKRWEDSDDLDGKRPESLVVHLDQVVTEGSASGGTGSKTVTRQATDRTLTAKDADPENSSQWTYTWTDLNKYEEGREISYVVREDGAALAASGYTAQARKVKATKKSDATGSANALYQAELTNTYTPQRLDIQAVKVWDDEGDRDGRRQDVTLRLLADGQKALDAKGQAAEDQTIAKDAAGDGLTVTWPDMPEKTWKPVTPETGANPSESGWYEKTGDSYKKSEDTTVNVEKTYYERGDIRYSLVEVEQPGTDEEVLLDGDTKKTTSYGYTVSIRGSAAEGFTVTNSYTPEVAYIKAVKHWDDNRNQDGTRNEKNISMKVHIYRTVGNATTYVGTETSRSITTAEGSSVLFGPLPVYEKQGETSVKVKYTIQEEASAIYETKYLPGRAWAGEKDDPDLKDQASGIALSKNNTQADPYIVGIKNSAVKATADVTVTKVWEDDENVDGKRPSGVCVDLYRTSAADPSPAAGDALREAVEEKIGEDPDKMPPETIGDWTLADRAEVTGSDDWTHTFTGLDRNEPGSSGKTLVYYGVEEPIGNGYAQTSEVGDQNRGFTITNSRERDTIRLKVTKTWDDGANVDGSRPSREAFEGSLRLLRGTAPDGTDATDVTRACANKLEVTVSGHDYIYTWTDLPKNKTKDAASADVTPYCYFITEAEIPKGYTAYDSSRLGSGADRYSGATALRKTDRLQPAFAEGSRTGTVGITNYHEADTTSLTARKIWMDRIWTDQGWVTAPVRPDSVTLTLQKRVAKDTAGTDWAQWQTAKTHRLSEADAGDLSLPGGDFAAGAAAQVWTYTFTDLPETEKVDGASHPIQYRVRELDQDVPAGYVRTYAGQQADGSEKDSNTIINSYQATSITGSKVWEDDDASVTHDTSREVKLTVHWSTEGYAPSADEVAQAGKTYYVRSGRTYTAVTQTAGKAPAAEGWYEEHSAEGKVKDAHIDWEDSESNPPEADRYTVRGLARYDKHGNPYTYWVTESAIRGYETSYDNNNEEKLDTSGEAGEKTDLQKADKDRAYNGGTITNTAEESLTIPVSKVWEDGRNRDAKRPESVQVSLKAKAGSGLEPASYEDGKPVPSLTLSEDNNWKDAFRGLPPTDGSGDAIDYVVTEDPVPQGYTAKVEYQSGAEDHPWSEEKPSDWNHKVRITNSYSPQERSITATKIWKGETDEIGTSLRTDVVLHLYGLDENGLVVYDGGTRTIDRNAEAGDGEAAGTARWNNVPKRYYESGELTWMVAEEPVFGFSSQITGDAEDGFTVTNTYAGPTAEVAVTKEWKDTYYEDYTERPQSVTYELWRKVGDQAPERVDGEDKTVTAEDDWAAEWKDLPVTSQVETEAETGEDTAAETGEGNGTDTGDGNDTGADTGTDTGVDTGANTEGGAGEDTLLPPEEAQESAPEMKEVPILYSVKEKALKGYLDPVVEAESPGRFKVTNIHETRLVDYTVTKAWNDSDDADGIRPDHITVMLMDGDEVVSKAVLTAEEDWIHTFRGVPATDARGQEIQYRVDEKDVPGYAKNLPQTLTAGEAANVITNTHTQGSLYDVTATKIWEGDEEHRDQRQDVRLTLMKKVGSGEDQALKKVRDSERTIPADAQGDALSVTWEDMPSREKGQPVAYTVEEQAIDGYKTTIGETVVKEPEAEGGKGTMTIQVTNTYQPQPTPPEPADHRKLTYLDPLAAQGKMILNARLYDSADELKKAREQGIGKPDDPSHKNKTFLGWDLNVDEYGDNIMVARYSETVPDHKPVVTYVDGQMKKPILKTVYADDPSEVEAPADPKHKNLIFVGWQVGKDADGNVIFTARYKPYCSHGDGGDGGDNGGSGKDGKDGSAGYQPPSGRGTNTGDTASPILWILLMAAALAAATTAVILYRRRSRQK